MTASMSRAVIAGVVLAIGVTAVGAARAAENGPRVRISAKCAVPDEMVADSSALPHAAAALSAKRPLKIVALGSSGTLGVGGSGPQAAYPARLQAALAARFPAAAIEVVNKGQARQSAEQMLDRLASDVLSERPTLVIWETGTAEAVRGADVDQFIEALLAGVDRMQAAGIDVVLMDTQYSRATAQLINFEPYVDAIDHVASMRDLVHFPRFQVMRYWVETERFIFADRAPAEARNAADGVYDCLGQLLAANIARSISLK